MRNEDSRYVESLSVTTEMNKSVIILGESQLVRESNFGRSFPSNLAQLRFQDYLITSMDVDHAIKYRGFSVLFLFLFLLRNYFIFISRRPTRMYLKIVDLKRDNY